MYLCLYLYLYLDTRYSIIHRVLVVFQMCSLLIKSSLSSWTQYLSMPYHRAQADARIKTEVWLEVCLGHLIGNDPRHRHHHYRRHHQIITIMIIVIITMIIIIVIGKADDWRSSQHGWSGVYGQHGHALNSCIICWFRPQGSNIDLLTIRPMILMNRSLKKDLWLQWQCVVRRRRSTTSLQKSELDKTNDHDSISKENKWSLTSQVWEWMLFMFFSSMNAKTIVADTSSTSE